MLVNEYISLISRCSVPEVILETPVLRLEKCFLDYAYEQPVKLINNSDLPACYGLLSQVSFKLSWIWPLTLTASKSVKGQI